MKNQFRVLAFLGVVFSLLIFTFSLTTCSNPTEDEESGEMGTFTINLGGNGRAVGYPPSNINDIRFVVKFMQGATIMPFENTPGSMTLSGKIPIGVYTVEVEVFDKTDGTNSVLAVGGLTTGPTITIHTGNNDIHVTLYKTVKVTPDLHTVVVGNNKQFNADVHNDLWATVTWEVSDNNNMGTTISSSGLLTVAAGETASEIWVTATYSSDPTWRGSTKVDISDGGDGTTTNPFIVYDVATLQRVGTETAVGGWRLDASYKQTEDITLPTTPNWAPIGPSTTNPFTGTYEGNGKTITDLTINAPAVDYQGLFGYVLGAAAVVKNLNLASVSITGTTESYIGGVAAQVQNGGLIENCSVQGSISGFDNIGGIVGHNYFGTVRGCYVTSVTTITGRMDIGGVVGYNWSGSSLVEKCYAEADVSGIQSVGGVVGISNGTVQNCYATGNVGSTTGVQKGGVIGGNSNGGTVQNCYSTGNVIGQYSLGGISTGNSVGTVQNCVALGKNVTASLVTQRGRIDYGTSSRSNNYARDDMLVDGTALTPGTGLHNDEHGADLTSANWYNATWWNNAANWNTSGGASAWDFTNVWYPPDGTSLLPTLRGVGGTQTPGVTP